MKALDIKETSAIAQALDAVLKAAGFALLQSRRLIGGQGQAVYELEYAKGKGERVFVMAYEPPKG